MHSKLCGAFTPRSGNPPIGSLLVYYKTSIYEFNIISLRLILTKYKSNSAKDTRRNK
ncbi:hypothetical protein SXCC_02267 [Gluconacetobacter sp. SXCC-1]|nr:hypothetical protein SXCC_02267 [Gluconacetobacter sp. SXCC-1]